jgi:hypothetical protein
MATTGAHSIYSGSILIDVQDSQGPMTKLPSFSLRRDRDPCARRRLRAHGDAMIFCTQSAIRWSHTPKSVSYWTHLISETHGGAAKQRTLLTLNRFSMSSSLACFPPRTICKRLPNTRLQRRRRRTKLSTLVSEQIDSNLPAAHRHCKRPAR